MRRSRALAPLSRDHQHALDVALRLRRADAATLDTALQRFSAFFQDEGRAHFAIEEEHLLGALPADDAEWADAVARVRDDHAAIRAQARTIADARHPDTPAVAGATVDVAAARALGERLHAHVRFEERVLFALLEARLAPDALERLGGDVARAEALHRHGP